ncbi:MAG TPA: hypothetical protein VGK04_12025 [Thermoanaerobaculia bacterium]|jgi:hypothetical protein
MAEQNAIDLVILQRELFSNAKTWFGSAQVTRMAAIVAGLASLLPSVSRFVPFAVFILAAASDVFAWQSEKRKKLAERALRLVEAKEGLGISVSSREIADIGAESPARVREAARAGAENAYYASDHTPGPRRVLQNLQESAWWTKHLSGTMLAICVWFIAIVTTLSIAFLVTSINLALSAPNITVVARLVTAVLMVLFSLGVIRMAVGYANLRDRAQSTEVRAAREEATASDSIAALRILHEYQVARAGAPLIPDWVYRMRKKTLDALWKSQAS